ncbi:MAG: transposase [Lewinellaceae bacterium]|nr:transposase [Lewinellaceae bacterium]
MYGTLFQEAWAALSKLCADRHYLGARPGAVAVLHTWGQNLHYHPHIHCIVPGGGLRGGKWVSAREEFLVPVQALSAMFKGKFVSALRRHYRAGRLRLDGLCSRFRGKQAFDSLLNRLMVQDWVVYAKAPFAGPEQLLGYLGRYTHRVAIGNHRIASLDKDTVCFRWRDYAHGNRQKVMCLAHEEFIRRFLQHVLPARFCKIRYSSPAEALAKEGRHLVQPVAKAGFGPLQAGLGGKSATPTSSPILARTLPAGCRHRLGGVPGVRQRPHADGYLDTGRASAAFS